MTSQLTNKIQKIIEGEKVVMSDEELDWLDSNNETLDYASLPNPNRVGILDAWVVFTPMADK